MVIMRVSSVASFGGTAPPGGMRGVAGGACAGRVAASFEVDSFEASADGAAADGVARGDDGTVHPRNVHPRNVHPRNVLPGTAPPRLAPPRMGQPGTMHVTDSTNRLRTTNRDTAHFAITRRARDVAEHPPPGLTL